MTDFATLYGLSLYSLCKEDNITNQVKEDLALVSSVFEQSPEYIKLLDSPMVKKNERCSLIDDAFKNHISQYTLNFLKILAVKNAIHKFSLCKKVFIKKYNEENNIETAVAVTAVPLDDKLKERLTEKLSDLLNKKIELENKIDENVIGGLVVRFANTQIDASLKTRLTNIKKQLSEVVS